MANNMSTASVQNPEIPPLQVGRVVRVNDGVDTDSVIVDVSETPAYSHIVEKTDGGRRLGAMGTLLLANIVEIKTERWTLDEIIDGLQQSCIGGLGRELFRSVIEPQWELTYSPGPTEK